MEVAVTTWPHQAGAGECDVDLGGEAGRRQGRGRSLGLQ